MATKSISQLNAAVAVDSGTLFETATPDAGSATGYKSENVSAALLCDYAVNGATYPTALPNMQNKTVADAIETLLENFAPVYDATATYAEGDLCTYNGTLYVANTTISTAEAWTPAHWTQTTAAQSGGGGGGSTTHEYSTTPQKIGKWVDGKDIWEKTYVFNVGNFQNQTINSSVMKGQLWLDISGTAYDTIWIDYGKSFLMNTNRATSAPKSHPLNYLSETAGTSTRTNIQRTDASNNGKPFVYFENTYNQSGWYNIRNDLKWYIVIQWTEVTTP